jgi:hypothetical protein
MWGTLKLGREEGQEEDNRIGLIGPKCPMAMTRPNALDVGVRERSSLANNNNVTCTVAGNAANIQT